MKTCVFLGPTLGHRDAREILDAIYLPPAAQGDVYGAVQSGAAVVAIVDGYFERVPAVWHREILWAMSQGLHVFGSASMGALRAAELHSFGMVGVGDIFDAYRRGDLEDDDEVTIVHADAESDYRAASEAMVNIRATMAAAVRQSIISVDAALIVQASAKSLFYPDRHYPTILRGALEAGAAKRDIERLKEWLPAGAVNQKRADALAMLRQIAAFRASAPASKSVTFHFQHTDAWEQVRRQIERRSLDTLPGIDTLQSDAVLDELRLRTTLYGEVRRAALIRRLSLSIAHAEGDHVGASLLDQAIEAFRRERQLLTVSELERWLAAQGLSCEELERLIEEDALARRIQIIHEADIDRYLGNELRLSGDYCSLAARARHKHDVLAAHGLDYPSAERLGVTEPELWQWFFDEVVGTPVPALDTFASALNLSSIEELRRIALRELAFTRLRSDQPNGANTPDVTRVAGARSPRPAPAPRHE
jgi:hypothetical protein